MSLNFQKQLENNPKKEYFLGNHKNVEGFLTTSLPHAPNVNFLNFRVPMYECDIITANQQQKNKNKDILNYTF